MVVLPASGWEMIANVRRWATCAANSSLNMLKIYNLCTHVYLQTMARTDGVRKNLKLAQL